MWRITGVIVSVFLLAGFLVFFIQPDGEQEVLERLRLEQINPEQYYSVYDNLFQVSTMVIGDTTKSKLLLIHGSPGDWSNWENIIVDSLVRAKYCIMAVDRAGFGKTTVPALPDLKDQAKVIWAALSRWQLNDNTIIVGHSYGGAVVEQLLLDHPGYFKRGIMVAPTLSPEFQAPRWYNTAASLWLVNLALPIIMKNSNIEMMGLPKGLQANEPSLAGIRVPIYYIQGKKDFLVPYQTMDYFKKYGPIQTKFIVEEEMNHFTPWSDPQLIVDAILD